MEVFFRFLPVFCLLLVYPYLSFSLPMCTTLRAPVIANEALSFCPYKGRVCCDSSKDSELQKQFEAMNISDPNCATVIKSIVCATCDQFSANLFTVESQPRSVPILCDSPNPPDSSKLSETSFCTNVWDTCQNIPIQNSPFAPALQGTGDSPHNTSSKLTDLWQSRTDFCTAFGRPQTEKTKCFNGSPIQLNLTQTQTPVPPKGLCLEKLGDKGYINMAAHPDGSNRAFFSDLPGKIWLVTVPVHGSGDGLGFDESSPFVDLTDQVKFDTVFGLMGIAFHPKFVENGRFFASFNCDKEKSSTCAGRCGCNTDVGCDASKIGGGGGDEQPCRYHNVVAEYTVNGTASEPKKATKGKPTEVRRIFTMGLPFTNNHGGQILFGPNDGYMYIMLGDGGGRDGPFGFAQNKKSLLGKIMRVDVDTVPKADDLSLLWGNYSIPRDNPYVEDKEMLPEIWALGLRNPWRCSFDSERPSYFLCTDVGQDRYEEIDVITKGGNYGWSIYEGNLPVESKGNTSNSNATDVIFPAMGYNHYDVNKKEGSAAITGGVFYRSTTDPCLYGSYLYADLYATALWAASETPPNSGNFTTTSIPFTCAHDSPLQCTTVPNTNLAALGYIYSFGEDNQKDVFVLASTGVYRVVAPSRCSYTCSKENATGVVTTPRGSPPSSRGSYVISKSVEFVVCLSLMLYFL